MPTCPSCGHETAGRYCDLCGGRTADPRKDSRPRGQPRAAGPSGGPVRAPGLGRRPAYVTALALCALLLFGSGLVSGAWLARSAAVTGTGLYPTPGIDQAAIEAMTPLAQANFFLETGVSLLNQGHRSAAVSEFRKAITAFNTVLRAEPENLFAGTYLGLTYYYAGDAEKAEETLLAVLEQDPSYLWAIFNLAWVYEVEGETDAAVAMYQRYLEAAPAEREHTLKYAEQPELIDKQIGAAHEAIARLSGGGDEG